MSFVVVLALLLAPADSKVIMLDGQVHSGQLTIISASDVSLRENGTDTTLPLPDVMAIDLPSAAAGSPEDPQLLLLRDGSQLHGSAVARTARQLSIQSAEFGKVEINTDAAQSVRLQSENPAFRDQWNTFLKRDTDKDLLVVAKRDGSGLDFLAGIVSSIGPDKTEFLLDGETVPVPSSRVYGVIFPRTPSNTAARPNAAGNGVRVTSVRGDVLVAKSVTLRGDEQLQIEASWGQTLQVTPAQIRKIDFSSGRVQFLSDLATLSERFDGVDPEGSLLAGLIDKEQQLQLFGPRRDTTMERQSRLRLRGREFSKGLCIHSRTEMSWALDGRFSVLDCLAGIDDEVAFNGTHSVSLKISGDGVVLFEKLIATTDDPIPLRIPVEGVSTLTVLVDFGDGDSVCDWLDLADAKLIIAKDKR
jgi:hypothetical protein